RLGDLALDGEAVLLGLQHLRIGPPDAHQLERHLGAALRVPGEVHVADGTAPQELADLEASDLLLDDHGFNGSDAACPEQTVSPAPGAPELARAGPPVQAGATPARLCPWAGCRTC